VQGGRVPFLARVPVLAKLRTTLQRAARQAPMASNRGFQKEEEEEEKQKRVPAASPCTRACILP
jgi:hypothetical protein